MTEISIVNHHYMGCCCCKIDISRNVINKELFKLIYYTLILVASIVYNFYYFTNIELLIEKSQTVLGCFAFLSFSLLLIYILNLIHLIFIITKHNRFVNITRITPLDESIEDNNNIEN